jgi:hypothetical protein
MRFQITEDFAGLKAGAVVDTSEPDCPAKDLTIPLSARPLDEAAWQAQVAAYPDHRYLLGGGWQ